MAEEHDRIYGNAVCGGEHDAASPSVIAPPPGLARAPAAEATVRPTAMTIERMVT
jgi:hypothetical protein